MAHTVDGLWYEKFRQYVMGGMDPDEAHKRADLDYPKQEAAAPRPTPEGWQIVPVKPTEEMVRAAYVRGPYDGSGKDWGPHYYRAMLAAAPPPEGWRLVPVEPTEEMWSAGEAAFFSYDSRVQGDEEIVGEIYRAMLAASPSPP